jgi:hypothetical protein
MSADEVDTIHIDALLTAGMPRRGTILHWHWGNPTQGASLNAETAGRVGAMLLAENRRSVNHLYTEDEIEQPYEYKRASLKGGWVAVLSALACYEYQSCEHAEWPDSEAYAFCDALRRHAIRQLPGYSDARRGTSRPPTSWRPDARPWGSAEPAP